MNTQPELLPVTGLIAIDTGAPTAELMAETDLGWLWRKLAETRVTLGAATPLLDDPAATEGPDDGKPSAALARSRRAVAERS